MRLIDADALKEQAKELLDLAVKRVDDTPNNSPCYRMYVTQENELTRLIDLIDNAPTVEMPNDILKAYYLGYSQAKVDLERPQGEWIANPLGNYVCNKCSWVVGKFERNFCPNCGADMRGGVI